MAQPFGRFNALWSPGRRTEPTHERHPAARHSLHAHNLAGTRPPARSQAGTKSGRRVPLHMHRFIFVAAGLLAVIVVPLTVIPLQQAEQSHRGADRGPPQGNAAGAVQVADASGAVPAPAQSPLIAIPKAYTGNEPFLQPRIGLGPGRTIASWYGGKPVACWQNGKKNLLPSGIKMWAADKSLPCGATIEVAGPSGTADLLIEDHGPYLTPDRGLDLSPEAFKKVVGPLAVGIAIVSFKVTRLG